MVIKIHESWNMKILKESIFIYFQLSSIRTLKSNWQFLFVNFMLVGVIDYIIFGMIFY